MVQTAQKEILDTWRNKKRLLFNLRLEDQIQNRDNELLTTDWSKLVDKYTKFQYKQQLMQLKIDKWELFANFPDYPSPEDLVKTETRNKKIESKSEKIMKSLCGPQVQK